MAGLTLEGQDVDEQKLSSILEKNIEDSENYYDSHIKSQRTNGYIAYYGQRLGNEVQGRSHHISRDIFNAVESTKAVLIETFASHKDAVYFPPRNATDYIQAQQATKYTNYVFYGQNNGAKIIENCIHDALVAKMGIIKRYWMEKEESTIETFFDISEEELEALESQPDVEIRKLVPKEIEKPVMVPNPRAEEQAEEQANQMKEAALAQSQASVRQMQGLGEPALHMDDPEVAQAEQQAMEDMNQQQGPTGEQTVVMTTVYDGELVRMKDASQVKIENVPPEDFLIDPYATCFEDFDFIAERKLYPKSTLYDMGFDPEIIEELKVDEKRYGWNRWEKQGRHDFDSSFDYFDYSGDTKDRQKVTLYEIYKKIDLDGDGISELYQIFYCDNKILDMELVDELPYEKFDCYSIPHKFYGLSIPDVLWDIQKSKSTIERQIIDNMALTNNTRYIADLGFIRNPRDLVDNRIGAVINVTNMDAIRPMPAPQLNPQAFAVIEMLEQDKELATGITRLSQGLNGDVVSKQNSANLIDAMSAAANKRTMMFAKNFAEDTLKPLMHAIYRLCMRFEKREKFMLVNDNYTPVDPKNFDERADLHVKVALTPDDQAKRGNSLLMVHQTLSQSEGLALNYGSNEQYALMEKVMDYMDVDGREIFLKGPNSPEYQQAAQQQSQAAQEAQAKQDQIMQLENALKQAQAQALLMNAETDRIRIQGQQAEDDKKIQEKKIIDEEKINIDYQALDWKKQYEAAQIELEKMKIQSTVEIAKLKPSPGSMNGKGKAKT